MGQQVDPCAAVLFHFRLTTFRKTFHLFSLDTNNIVPHFFYDVNPSNPNILYKVSSKIRVVFSLFHAHPLKVGVSLSLGEKTIAKRFNRLKMSTSVQIILPLQLG